MQRAPHRVALAQRRRLLGQQVALLEDPCAAWAAIRSVRSRDAASTTTTSSTSPASRNGATDATTPAIVSAHCLVGMITVTDVLRLAPASRRSGNSVASYRRRSDQVETAMSIASPRGARPSARLRCAPDVGGPQDRDPMRAQALFECRVLERGHRLEAAHLPVHGGGHADRGAGEVMMAGGGSAFADAPEPSRGVALRRRSTASGSARGSSSSSSISPAIARAPFSHVLELPLEPVRIGTRVGIGAGDRPCRVRARAGARRQCPFRRAVPAGAHRRRPQHAELEVELRPPRRRRRPRCGRCSH